MLHFLDLLHCPLHPKCSSTRSWCRRFPRAADVSSGSHQCSQKQGDILCSQQKEVSLGEWVHAARAGLLSRAPEALVAKKK